VAHHFSILVFKAPKLKFRLLNFTTFLLERVSIEQKSVSDSLTLFLFSPSLHCYRLYRPIDILVLTVGESTRSPGGDRALFITRLLFLFGFQIISRTGLRQLASQKVFFLYRFFFNTSVLFAYSDH